MASKLAFVCLILQASILYGSHFRGGTITWRPFNNTPSGASVNLLVRQRYSWRRSFGGCFCAQVDILNNNTISGGGSCTCVTPPCGSWSILSTTTRCTDFSALLDVSSGEIVNQVPLPLNISFSIGFVSSAWFTPMYVGNGLGWSVINRINTAIRPDGYINTSPIAVTLPIIFKEINIQHVYVVQMSDFDSGDDLRCRWSNASGNINSANECGGVCSGLPGANLIQNNCTLVFTLTVAGWYAAVALQIEDYYNIAATVPMSSVPLQFLFYGYAAPTGNCTTPPAIIGNRPNRACIGIPPDNVTTESIIIQVYCPGKSIIDLVSSSPVGLIKSAILNPSAGIYQIDISWTPTVLQNGPQSLCVGAVDNTNIQSNQWCITYVVGFLSPTAIQPTMVQGSASPLGTVFQNQTLFSIQTNKYVNRPTRNGTNIYFYDSTAGNTLVQKYDCGWAPEVTFTGYTIVIRFPVAPWIPGHFYYVTMDGGVASGTEFCGPESDPINSTTFWVFNIWNPALSSTTTTTTTFPTTGTVTTRPTSTTTTNPLLTTTGIVITTTLPVTTTATTSTAAPPTTAPPTTAGPTGPSVTTLSTVAVMYPKDFEDACKQPIAMMSAIMMAVMMPIQALTMYAAFTKFSNMFNPSHINAKTRHQQRMKRILRH